MWFDSFDGSLFLFLSPNLLSGFLPCYNGVTVCVRLEVLTVLVGKRQLVLEGVEEKE